MSDLDIKFAVGIPHKGGDTLRDAQFLDTVSACQDIGQVRTFTSPAPNHIWSEEMWRWGSEQPDCTHFLSVQDDVELHEDFEDVLSSIVAAKPDDVICLHTPWPACRNLHKEGARWASTADGMVGVAYVLPMSVLAAFLEWRSALPAGAVEAINEDTLLGLFCQVTGRRILHPIPSPVSHVTGIKSTYGNDTHANRHNVVPPDNDATLSDDGNGWWATSFWDEEPHHLGRVFNLTPLAAKWLDAPPSLISRMLADNGIPELVRMRHAQLGAASQGKGAKARVLICTPTRGGVHPDYAASIWRLLKEEMCDIELASEIADVQVWHEDVVRIRSRYVQFFLSQEHFTHLLFLDSDVRLDPVCLRGMLQADVDFVAAPYPRRDTIDWERVKLNAIGASQGKATALPTAAHAYKYSVRIPEAGINMQPNHCTLIDGIGLGCSLLSRRMLLSMREMCDIAGLTFIDRYPDGAEVETTAMFALMLGVDKDGKRRMYSEDYSFCERVRALQYPLWMYLGPGSPIDHYGEHRYEGALEAFGIMRVRA